MAKTFSTSFTPATSALAMYQFKVLLIAAGWVTKSSGDGLSAFNASGDVISSGNSGANGLGNSRAWWRMQDAAGLREFVIQRGSNSNQHYWIQYSASAKFTGGSPTFQTVPTATDQQNVVGTASTGTQLFTGTENSMRYHMMAENSAPYTFYIFCYSTGGSTTRGWWMMDSLQAGSYDVLDTDPIVNMFASSGTDFFSAAANTVFHQSQSVLGSAGVFGWIKLGLAGAGYVSLCLPRIVDGANPCLPGALPVSPYTGKDEVFAPICARYSGSTAPQGYKGALTNVRWIGPQRALSGDTLTVNSTNDYIILEKSWALPFDGTTPLV